MGNAAKAQFVPDMNIDDKGKFQNSFVELGLVISGDPSNSRVTFSVGFEAIFQQVGSANFVLKDDGTLEIVSSDMPNSIPVIFTICYTNIRLTIWEAQAHFLRDMNFFLQNLLWITSLQR